MSVRYCTEVYSFKSDIMSKSELCLLSGVFHLLTDGKTKKAEEAS